MAASLTARFAKVDETPPTQMPGAKGGKKGVANGVLAAAAAAAITAAVVPEHVTEVFDRTEQAIEQWKLNTVMEVGSGPGARLLRRVSCGITLVQGKVAVCMRPAERL